MQSVYRLKATELDNHFLEGLKATYQDKEIEIIVCEVNKTENSSGLNTHQEKASVVTDSKSISQRRAFLKLPLAERRRILAQQASETIDHYQQHTEWQEWLAGDIIDY